MINHALLAVEKKWFNHHLKTLDRMKKINLQRDLTILSVSIYYLFQCIFLLLTF